MSYVSFQSAGLTRRYTSEGDLTTPTKAWICLDGGEDSIGASILSRLTPVADEVFVGPDGLVHKDGTQLWIKSWTPMDAVLQPGVTRTSDVQMLADLRRAATSRWPSLGKAKPIGLGHSGGASLLHEHQVRGDPNTFAGVCCHKFPLHPSQVDASGAADISTPVALLLWFSDNDPKFPSATPDKLSMQETVEAYKRRYGVVGDTVTTEPFGQYTIERHTYTVAPGLPPLTLLWQHGGGHTLAVGTDRVVRDFFT